MWLSFSAAAHAAATALGGRGNRRSARALCGVALSLPVFVTMWVPETIMALLLVSGRLSWDRMRAWGERGAGLRFHFIRQIVGVFWTLALTTLALKEDYSLPWPKATLAALTGMMPAAAMTALVIR